MGIVSGVLPVPELLAHRIAAYLWGWALLLAIVTYLNILHISNYVLWSVAKLTNSASSKLQKNIRI